MFIGTNKVFHHQTENLAKLLHELCWRLSLLNFSLNNNNKSGTFFGTMFLIIYCFHLQIFLFELFICFLLYVWLIFLLLFLICILCMVSTSRSITEGRSNIFFLLFIMHLVKLFSCCSRELIAGWYARGFNVARY